MKKNLFWSMLAMSGMLFATSCSQDELVNESAGDFVSATFNIGTADGIGSRATIGNGTKVDKVACAVYDANGKEMEDLYKIENVSNGTATYSVRLAKGQNYRIAFFAYNEAANAYDVEDLTNIKVNPSQNSNIEARDAFTAYYDVVTGKTMNSINETVELYRPFAQLNLGIDNDEYLDAKKAGIIVDKSYIKVSNVHTAFSAYDNAVVAGNTAQTMEFALYDIPVEKLYVDDEEYHYLAMNYLLVGDKGAAKELTDVEFAWESTDGKKNNPTTKFYNIPVERNYRTNIIGRLLTSPADFNIVIKPAFDGDKNHDIDDTVTDQVTTVAVYDQQSLQAAIDGANAAGNYSFQFTEDILDNQPKARAASPAEITITQKPGVNITIDGNGYQFDGTFKFGADNNGHNVSSTLTFKNINFVHSNGDIDFLWANSKELGFRYAHNVTVDNCTFTGNDNGAVVGMRYRQTAFMVVKNCTFTKMYSMMWATGSAEPGIETILIDNVKVSDSKSGVSFGTAERVVVKNSEFDVREFGIRANGEGTYKLTVENTAIDAKQPIIVRKTTGAYVVELKGTNTLTTSEQYHVVFTSGEDDAAYVAPTSAYSITGAENLNVFPGETANEPAIATSAAQLTSFLANTSISEILLGEGAIIEGTFAVTRAVTISSVSADNKATIKGRINVSGNSAGSSFNNIKFAINDATKHKNTFTGAPYQYPASVMIECVATSFEGCEFVTSLADGVCGINYGNSAAGQLLTVNNCTFKGDFYAIRSRTMFSITNSEFDIYTTEGTLAAVWSWGGGGSGTATSVTFTGNTNVNTNKIYGVQMFASNYTFDNIKFNVQNNINFLKLSEGVNPARDFTGKSFAEGSETF